MIYQSFLSTHPYYLYDNNVLFQDGKETTANKLFRELKSNLSKFDLDVTYVNTLEGKKLIIFMYEGFSDEVNEKGIGVMDNEFQNFDKNDISEMKDSLKLFLDYIKANGSKELNEELAKMKLVDVSHYIYFSKTEEE